MDHVEPLQSYMDRLVQYPPEVITRSFERASEMSSSLWAVDPSGTTPGFPSTTGTRLVRHVKTPKSKNQRRSSTAASTTTTATVKDVEDQESVMSDASFEVVSNVSSQSPSTSFVVPNSNDIPTEATQQSVLLETVHHHHTDDELFCLRRENSNLKGQVNSMKMLLEEVTRDRTALQNQVDFLEKETRHVKSLVSDLEASKLKLELEKENFRRHNIELANQMESLQHQVDDKEQEFKRFQADRRAIEEENEDLRVRIEKIRLDFDSQRGREKEEQILSRQQEDNMESMIKDKTRLEEKISSLQKELLEVQKLKDGSSSQVTLLQSQFSDLQRKHVEGQSESLALRRHIEQLEKTNFELKTKMSEMESSSYKPSEDDSSSEIDSRSLPPSSAEFLKEKAKFVGYKRDSEIIRLRRELNELRVYADQVIANERKINAKHLASVQKELRERIQEFSSVQAKNKEYETKMSSLNISLSCQKEFTDNLQKEKIAAEAALSASYAKQKELQAVIENLNETNERLEKNLREYAVQVAAKDTKIQSCFNQIERLEERIRRSEESEKDVLSVELPRVRQENQDLKAVIEDLKQSLNRHEVEQQQYQAQIRQLVQDKNLLENELEKERNKVIEAPAFDPEKDKKIRSLEANVKLILRKYNEAMQSKKSLEEKILSMQSTATDASSTDNLIQELQTKLSIMEQDVVQKNSLVEEKNSLILRLEQEKGEMIQKRDTDSILEVKTLRETVKKQSYDIEDARNQVRNISAALDQERKQAAEMLSQLKENLEKDEKSLKEARHSLFLEKRDHSKTKKDLETLKENLRKREEAIQTLQQEVSHKDVQLKSLFDSDASLRQEIDRLNKLVTDLQDNQKQAPTASEDNNRIQPLIEQINHYTMLLMEKDQEIERLNLNYSSLQRQYEYDTSQLHQSLHQSNQSAEYSQSELTNCRNQVYHLQTEICQIKSELKNLYDSNCRLRSELEKSNVFLKDDIYANADVIQGLLNQQPNNLPLDPSHR